MTRQEIGGERGLIYVAVVIAAWAIGVAMGMLARERIDPDREMQLQRIIDRQRERIEQLIPND